MSIKTIMVQYIFTSPQEIEYGLMNRNHPITFSTTALFIFPEAKENITMWMKNTYDSLDIIFINSEKKVVCIHKNAIPHDLTPLLCSYETKYVVEALAGYTDDNDIIIGDIVEFIFMGILNYNDNYKLKLL